MLAAFLPLQVTGFTVGPTIFTTTRSVLLAERHPLAAHAAVCWDDLADYGVAEPVGLPEQFRAAITPPVTPSGKPLKRILRVNTLMEVFAGVANGVIVHPTAASFADFVNFPGIVARPIVDAELIESAILYRSGPPSGPVAAFLEIAEARMQRAPTERLSG